MGCRRLISGYGLFLSIVQRILHGNKMTPFDIEDNEHVTPVFPLSM